MRFYSHCTGVAKDQILSEDQEEVWDRLKNGVQTPKLNRFGSKMRLNAVYGAYATFNKLKDSGDKKGARKFEEIFERLINSRF